MDTITHYREAFEQLRRRGDPGLPAWLWQLRGDAFRAFASEGFPTKRNEEWRYTSVAPIERTAFHDAGDVAQRLELAESYLREHALPNTQRLVFVDGLYAAELSRSLTKGGHGLRVCSIGEALRQDEALLRAHLGRYASAEGHPFGALNAALMRDGAFVYVPAGVALDEPIELCFVRTFAAAQTVAHLHNVVVAEDGARVSLTEIFAGPADAVYWSNVVTEIALGPGAAVERHKVQREGSKAYHVSGLHVHQAQGSSFCSRVFSLGGALVRDDVVARLLGEGVSCVLDGLLLASGEQHVDAHTVIDHVAPHGTSAELYKGVFNDRATGVFNGKIFVRPKAQQTDARQSNRNLLLSPDATVDAKPQLEIFADDVRCTHGATVGQLDRDAVFYLRARGLDDTLARRLLTHAFAKEVVDRVRWEALRLRLDEVLELELGRVIEPDAREEAAG